MSETGNRGGYDKKQSQTPERVAQAAAEMQARQATSSSGWKNGYTSQRESMRQYESQQAAMRQYYAQKQGFTTSQQTGWQTQGTGNFRPDGLQRGYMPPSAGMGPAYGNTQASLHNGQKPPRKKSTFPVWLLIVVLAAALVTGVMVFVVKPQEEARQLAATVSPFDSVFCEGVYVDGIHLGGMTPEQAYNSVVSQINQRSEAWKVTLAYQGRTVYEINAGMLGMSVDIGAVLNEAWRQGHLDADGNVLSNEERLQAMESLKTTPYTAYTAIPSGDTSVIDAVLESLKSQIDCQPVDAALTGIDTTLSYPFVFTEEQNGLVLDTAPIKARLYEMVATLQSGTVELQPEVIAPSVLLVDLKKHYELRSSMYTPISTSSTEDRNENIRVAFSRFDGYELKAGKQFSFNSVVGERTEKAGFKPAVEYVYGEHVEGIGGGVCQASTTLYQAVVCAGLQVVKRDHHSDAVGYTEYGKDATVYWNGKRKIDFVFKNNTDESVYIFASVQTDPSNKKRLIARVSIYGEYMNGVRYEMETQTVKILEPPEKPVYIKDTNGTYVTYTDQQQTVSKAQEGYVVESYRVEYVDNQVTDRKLLYTDTFEAKAERIYVGVKRRE